MAESSAAHQLKPVGRALAAAQGTPLARNGAFWKALRHAAGERGRVAVLVNAHLPDDFHFAKGVAVELPADAPLPLDLLNHARALSVVATAPLPDNVQASPETLARVRSTLDRRAAAAPLRLDALALDGSPRDRAHWEPALGARGVLAVCRTKRGDEFGLGDSVGHDYHLVYTGGPEGLLDEVYGKLRALPADNRPTVGAFVSSPMWRAVTDAAERNARGVLAVAAEELGASVPTAPDTRSCYAGQTDVAPPALAVASHLQHNGGFATRENGQRIVALAGATSTTRAHNGRLLVALGPLHGFAAYPVRAGVDCAWPVGPARVAAPAAPAPLPDVVRRLYGGVKHASADHPRLQPQRYAAPDRAFHQALSDAGWDRAAGREHYELVAATVHVDNNDTPTPTTTSPAPTAHLAPLSVEELASTMRAGSVRA